MYNLKKYLHKNCANIVLKINSANSKKKERFLKAFHQASENMQNTFIKSILLQKQFFQIFIRLKGTFRGKR